MRWRELGCASRRAFGKAFGGPFGSAFSHVALLVTNARKRYIEIWHFFSGEMPKHMHGNAGKQVRILRGAATVSAKARPMGVTARHWEQGSWEDGIGTLGREP